MKSGNVRTAGIVVLLALLLCVVGTIVSLDIETLKNDPGAFSAMFAGAGWIAIGLVAVVVLGAMFGLTGLETYLNVYTGFDRADSLIRSLMICIVLMVVLGVLGFIVGGGSIVLLILGIISVVIFVFYFALSFRLKSYAKAHSDRPMRVYAILAILYCFAVLIAVLLAMVSAAAPQARSLVGIAGWVSSILQLATWCAFGVALIAGAGKMRAKGL